MTKVLDLRTDANTEPPIEMKRAMFNASMDSNGNDFITPKLEETVADLMGKESALFIPTGVMADLIPIMSYCGRGDGVIVGENCHVVASECGGASALAGAMIHSLPLDTHGMMNPKDLEMAIQPDSPPHRLPPTKLICLENTQLRCGGTVLTAEDQRQIAEIANRHGVPVWCDGARFANAVIHLGISFAELAKDLDAISFGFMKSLGVYTGSVLCGATGFIERARRYRTMLGGSLPMSGFLAAGCLWALEHGIERIEEDHINARTLGEAIANMKGLNIDLNTVQTNILLFQTDCIPHEEYVARLEKHGVRCSVLSGWRGPVGIRMVTDASIDRQDIESVVTAMHRALKK